LLHALGFDFLPPPTGKFDSDVRETTGVADSSVFMLGARWDLVTIVDEAILGIFTNALLVGGSVSVF
jgi:hypothetical protein